MGNDSDPILKVKAQTKLDNIAAKADLNKLGTALDSLFDITVPELKTITTKDELRSLITAIKAGTARNAELTKFVQIADTILSKI